MTTPVSVETIVAAARVHLRDTERFFQATVTRNSDASMTFKLPHPNVVERGLVVQLVGSSASQSLATPEDFVLDARNGLIRLNEVPPDGHLNVEGYYHQWFTADDMEYFARQIVIQHAHHVSSFSFEELPLAEADLMALGTVVEALWSLVLELARDIDLNTPEAVSLPLSQRYNQVMSALGAFENEYKTRAEALNVGLYRIEMFTLRRISLTTGRYVPIFRGREFDDASPPTRVFLPIPPIGSTTPPDEYHPIWDVNAAESMPPGVSP